jgi:hypothetical protein
MPHKGCANFSIIRYGYSSIIPQVLTAQINHDDRVCRLWNRIGDILDLVDPLGKYKDHRLYKKNVEAILKQVYECVYFLRWYADKGFTGTLFLIHSGFALICVAQFGSFAARFLIEPRMLSTNSSRHSKTYGNRCKMGSRSIKCIGWWQQQSPSRKLVRPGAPRLSSRSSCRITAVDVHLDRLPGATLSWVEYDKQKACLPGTRKELLKVIEEWIHSPGDGFYGCLALLAQGNQV